MPTMTKGIASSPFKNGDFASSQWAITNISETKGMNRYPKPQSIPAWKAFTKSMIPYTKDKIAPKMMSNAPIVSIFNVRFVWGGRVLIRLVV